jgi:hypothetical protein
MTDPACRPVTLSRSSRKQKLNMVAISVRRYTLYSLPQMARSRFASNMYGK